MKIGLSLSLCIKDIVSGKVDIGEVEYIVAGTCASDDVQWEKLMAEYAKTYWRDWPAKSVTIASDLHWNGKVEQPRLVKNDHYPIIASGHWVDSEDQIVWSDGEALDLADGA